MSHEHLAILGLAPGQHEPAELSRRFTLLRSQLLAQLHDPETHQDSRERLEALYRAYKSLRSGGDDGEPAGDARQEGIARLREMIAASLEGGLLRFSRRQEIIAEARRIGLPEFHAHLLIAQMQFDDDGAAALWERSAGDERVLDLRSTGEPRRRSSSDRERRLAARLAAACVLGLAMLLALIRFTGA